MAQFVATRRIKYGGVVYAPGGSFTATLDDSLRKLIRRGAVDIDAGSYVSKAKQKVARSGTISVSSSSTEETVVTWAEPFDDTDYTVAVSVHTAEGSLGESLTIERITDITASGVTVAVRNRALSSLSGTVHAIAVHD